MHFTFVHLASELGAESIEPIESTEVRDLSMNGTGLKSGDDKPAVIASAEPQLGLQ